jgi:general secretion pathway protein D
MMVVVKQVSGGTRKQPRPDFSSKEESQMKWCMVAAMAVSLLFGSMAFAQKDDFDLDALLGDVGTTTSAPAAVDTADVAVAPAAETPAPAAVEEAIVPAAEAAAADASATAETAVEEVAATAEAAMEDISNAVEEATPAAATEAVAVADPFADLAAEPAAESAPAEESIAPVEAPAPAAIEETVAPAEEPAPAAEEDMLGDLFAAEPVAEAVAAPAEEPAPVADEMTAAPAADSMDEGAEESAFISPVASKKAAKEVEKIPAKEIKKIAKETAQQEEVRRQAAEADALKASEAGFRSLSDGDLIAAENSFSSALKNLPDRPQNNAVREQISWGLAEAQYLRARGMVQKNERLADARKLVDSALKAAPTHRGAQALDKRLSKLEAIEAMPKAPADQPATVEKAKTVEQMYDEARQWYMLKDYDRASSLFENILIRDPYHKSAMRYLRKIEADKFKLATYERDARVQGMMTEVRRSWSPPIRAQIEMPEDFARPGGVDSKPAAARLQDKMKTIIIPAVEFRQANINDVVNFLVEASLAADPDKEGVNIILNLGQGTGGAPVAAPVATAPAAAAPTDDWGFGGEDFAAGAPTSGGGNVRDITLNLRRISMLDAIKYITEVAGLKYRIEDAAVIITPIDAPVGNIITRMYPVQPSFMDVIVERQTATSEERQDQEFTSMGGRVNVTKSDVKDFFEKTGVKFPVGASITYNATISQLIVANTADNLETFERILQQLNVVPNQVEIEARFIEVDQTDLEELGLQWILNDNYEIATATDGSGGRLQINGNKNGLTQGNRNFAYNSGNLNIEPASALTKTANQTMLGGILSASSVLTNPEMTVVIQALSQHGGTDLLSAPRVTTRSGVNAQIQVVKEIIYPTEFDVTQPTMNSDGNVTMSPVVTPGTFQTRETGVILNVTPTVGPDGYTIDLVMAPEVAELVDWIQYGSEITVETGIIGARQQNTYLFNMPQPIFTSRNVTTSIVIWDGQTVVMGGLIREELTTIKDKVPILGDIPVLGWLFRSEGQYSKKKNLLIFVTARLVDPAGRPIHREGTMAMPGAGIEAGAESADVSP